MINNIFNGFSSIISAIHLMLNSPIRRFIIIPLGINTLLFAAAIYLLLNQFGIWLDYFMPDFPSWLSWLETLLHWILWPLFSVMIIFLVFYSFSFIMNIIASPFNSLLAQKVEAHLKGFSIEDDSVLPPLKAITKGFSSEIQKLLYLIKWSILLLIISFIPVINLAAPFLWFIFGAWMLALNYMDYPMGNHQYFFKDINQSAQKNKSSILGLGSAIFLLTSIPVINFIAMPAAVTAATIIFVKQQEPTS